MADIAKLNSLELSLLSGISSTIGDNVYSVSTILWPHSSPYVPPVPFEYTSPTFYTCGLYYYHRLWEGYGDELGTKQGDIFNYSNNVSTLRKLSTTYPEQCWDYVKLDSPGIGAITSGTLSINFKLSLSDPYTGTQTVRTMYVTLCDKYLNEIGAQKTIGGYTSTRPIYESVEWTDLDLGEENVNNLYLKLSSPVSEKAYSAYIYGVECTLTGLAVSGTEYDGTWFDRTNATNFSEDWGTPAWSGTQSAWYNPLVDYGDGHPYIQGSLYKHINDDFGRIITKFRYTISGTEDGLKPYNELWYDSRLGNATTFSTPFYEFDSISGSGTYELIANPAVKAETLVEFYWWKGCYITFWGVGTHEYDPPATSSSYVTEISLFSPFRNKLISWVASTIRAYNSVWLNHLADGRWASAGYTLSHLDRNDSGYIYTDPDRSGFDTVSLVGEWYGYDEDNDTSYRVYENCEYILNIKIGHPDTGYNNQYIFCTIVSGSVVEPATVDLTTEESVINLEYGGGHVWKQVTWSGLSFDKGPNAQNPRVKLRHSHGAYTSYVSELNFEIIPDCARSWQNRTDIKYWDGDNMTWDGTKWSMVNVPGEYCYLHFKGPWYINARPNKIRIKVDTGGIQNFRMYDIRKDFVTAWQQPSAAGTYEYDIMTHGNDLGYIELHYFNDPTTISEISFYY